MIKKTNKKQSPCITAKEQGEEKVGYKHPPKKYQWKPGQSGNPNGQPKFSLVSILKVLLQETPEGKKEIEARSLMKEAIKKAGKGDTQMLRDIINRVDGMPKQSHQIEGEITNKFELNDEQFEQLIRRRTEGIDSDKSSKG